VKGVRSLGHALEGDGGTLAPSPSSLLFPGHEVSGFAPPPPPTMMCCLTTGPKAMGPANRGLKPPRL
jgi:hypothetical protein